MTVMILIAVVILIVLVVSLSRYLDGRFENLAERLTRIEDALGSEDWVDFLRRRCHRRGATWGPAMTARPDRPGGWRRGTRNRCLAPIGHLSYGAVVGAIYGLPTQATRAYRTI